MKIIIIISLLGFNMVANADYQKPLEVYLKNQQRMHKLVTTHKKVLKSLHSLQWFLYFSMGARFCLGYPIKPKHEKNIPDIITSIKLIIDDKIDTLNRLKKDNIKKGFTSKSMQRAIKIRHLINSFNHCLKYKLNITYKGRGINKKLKI